MAGKTRPVKPELKGALSMKSIPSPLQKVTAALATEEQPRMWVAEAAQLGLTAGQLPQSLETDLGNGQPLIYCDVDRAGAATYIQPSIDASMRAIQLRVFNAR
jgi:hypothetical protein